MFKIPESFKLGGISYRVKMFVERGGGMGLGQHDGKNSVIEIAQDVSPDRQAKTFVHESLHGIIEQYGVDIPDEQEEKIVSQLSTGITEMIDQIVEFNQDKKEPKYGRLLIRQICEVDRILTPLLDNNSKRKIMDTQLSEPVITKEEDPHGFCNMAKRTERLARLLKEQLDNSKEKS